MISVYKFGLFTTYKVDARVVTEFGMPNRLVKYSFQSIYIEKNNQIIVPVPKKIEVVTNPDNPHTDKIDITPLLNTVTDFTFEDKVYIHSDCAIPRTKVTQKYTRVLKPEKADICVVPKLERKSNTENLSIFINRDKGKIYVIENIVDWDSDKYTYYTSEKCSNFALGSCILDINPSLRDTLITERDYYGDTGKTFSMENWKDFLASTLLYHGPVLSLYTKESWIADLLYNKIHDVITEDVLLATLGDSTNEFTKEAYDNLKEMLKSTDETVVGLGLKAIAEMDYEKYRNTTIHLLCNNSRAWTRNDMRSNSSVKYMLNYLGLWRSRRENYANTTTLEDFTLMKEVVKSDFNERIEAIKKSFNSRFPFANLDLSYKFEVSPKLDGEEVASDRDIEDDDFDDEDWDEDDDV